MFTAALVKTPCKNMINGISSANLGKPDYSLALQQHENYITALKSCGLTVKVLDPDENFPDSTFIEDTCLITPKCSIIMNPGADTRKDETISIRAVIEDLGRPVEEITFPGTVDAGDIMMVGDHYYVGLSDRTNLGGANQLEKILKKYSLGLSIVKFDTVLHLKTGISYLENNNLLAWGEFLTKSEFQHFNILEISPDEAYAANSVWINDKVITPKGFSKTKQIIADAGYEVIEVDVSEFQKLDGGLSCLSLRF